MKEFIIRGRTIKAVFGWLSFEGPVWGWAIIALPRQCWRFNYHRFGEPQWSIILGAFSVGWWKKY